MDNNNFVGNVAQNSILAIQYSSAKVLFDCDEIKSNIKMMNYPSKPYVYSSHTKILAACINATHYIWPKFAFYLHKLATLNSGTGPAFQ